MAMTSHAERALDSSFDSNGKVDEANTGGRRRTMGRRGNSEGSIYQRKDGRWVAAVTDPRTGRQLYWYAKSRSLAAAKLNTALRSRDDGARLGAERQTVGEFLTKWAEHVARPTLRPSTFASYSGHIRRHLIPAFGQMQLAKLGPEHVQILIGEKLGDGLSPRRVLYIRAVLRRALSDAVRWGLVHRNAASLARGPKAEPGEVRPMTAEQVAGFLEAIDDDRLAALYVAAIALGLRQGELLGLRWDDIDLSDKWLRVRHALQRVEGTLQLVPPKTRQSRRTIQLPELVIDALVRHRSRQNEEQLLAGQRWVDQDFVFTTPHGRPLDASNVTHAFQRRLASAGLPRHRFHDLRHTCASLMLAEGINPRVVMDILGHSQVSVTLNTYSHVVPSVQRQAVERMDALLRLRGRTISST